jgi:hypothetical protein
MRSKFDHRLRIGLTPKRSANKVTIVNIVIPIVIGVNLGLYFTSANANNNQEEKAISTKILKKKAFPVINGKKNESTTIKGKIGIRNIEPRVI